MEGQDNLDRPLFSRAVKAGKRTYFLDVKATRSDDYYLTITESKKKMDDSGKFTYIKHKIFLYKEDFEKFREGLDEVCNFILTERPDMPVRTPYTQPVDSFSEQVKPAETPSEEAPPAPSNDGYSAGVNLDDW